jgi:cation diffusion facilitator CzcD-associated flavoprotein CzcO
VTDLDAVVVGAGFSGLYMLHRLRNLQGLSVRVFEAGDGVGGTWYWNRYPGARCDTESHLYCYSFSRELYEEWEWSAKYPSQPEILAYLEHVADRFELHRDIRCGTRVTAARFRDSDSRWVIETDRGETVTARYFITGVGLLASAPYQPEIPGLGSFEGESHHTGRWPHDPVDLAGKRIGVIGTGSTGVQTIPVLARTAEHLFVFQRTAQYAVPARPDSHGAADLAEFRRRYDELQAQVKWSANGFPWQHNGRSALAVTAAERQETFQALWERGGFEFVAGSYQDILLDRRANDFAAEFVRARIRDTVLDPVVAEALVPADHPIGSRRPVIDSGYYETYNRDNVTLVDVRSHPITSITPAGVATERGEYPLDVLIFATGFDAIAGPYLRIEITGRGGLRLADAWADGPRTYLGLAAAGFPNMFTITGPAATFGNIPVSIEHHVEWISDCVEYLVAHGVDAIEVARAAEDGWMDHVARMAEHTLIPLADSWFTGGNIPGKPRSPSVYFGNFGRYRRRCEDVAQAGYHGFLLDHTIDDQGVHDDR